MPVTVITRGNLAEFTVSFEDADGEPVTPSEVALAVNYLGPDGRVDADPITMTADDDDVFGGSWDTSVARPGRVYWSIKATDPEAAEDGFFDLKANPANLAT